MSTEINTVDVKTMLRDVGAKPVPLSVRRFYYCFGGLTFLTFLVQVMTGIILAMYYVPTPEGAHASIQFIMTEVNLGAVIRSIHRMASNLMVIFVLLHMLRVILTKSYQHPRQLNWIAGVCLLVLTLGFCFTGYLLIWDQVGYWAAVIGTQIAGSIPFLGGFLQDLAQGGSKVSGFTLSRFYALHIAGLPILAILFLILHFLMIRKQGISRGL